MSDVIKTLCPNCGNGIDDGLHTCSCGFSFSEVLKCPQKNEKGICEKIEKECSVSGMNYEACPFLREDNK